MALGLNDGNDEETRRNAIAALILAQQEAFQRGPIGGQYTGQPQGTPFVAGDYDPAAADFNSAAGHVGGVTLGSGGIPGAPSGFNTTNSDTVTPAPTESNPSGWNSGATMTAGLPGFGGKGGYDPTATFAATVGDRFADLPATAPPAPPDFDKTFGTPDKAPVAGFPAATPKDETDLNEMDRAALAQPTSTPTFVGTVTPSGYNQPGGRTAVSEPDQTGTNTPSSDFSATGWGGFGGFGAFGGGAATGGFEGSASMSNTGGAQGFSPGGGGYGDFGAASPGFGGMSAAASAAATAAAADAAAGFAGSGGFDAGGSSSAGDNSGDGSGSGSSSDGSSSSGDTTGGSSGVG